MILLFVWRSLNERLSASVGTMNAFNRLLPNVLTVACNVVNMWDLGTY